MHESFRVRGLFASAVALATLLLLGGCVQPSTTEGARQEESKLAWVADADVAATLDVLDAQLTHGADLEYLRILHLAATTLEAEVDAVLSALLATGARPTFDRVKAAVTPQRPPCPEIALTPLDLGTYDALLSEAAR